jgi:hypothetical protein
VERCGIARRPVAVIVIKNLAEGRETILKEQTLAAYGRKIS